MPIRDDNSTRIRLPRNYERNPDVDRLIWAAQISVNGIDRALDSGIDVNAQDSYGFTALFALVEMGKCETIAHLIRRGAAINHKTLRPGTTPLHYAAKRSCKEVSLLLDHGADPNIQDRHGRTPLHFAAYFGNPNLLPFRVTNRDQDVARPDEDASLHGFPVSDDEFHPCNSKPAGITLRNTLGVIGLSLSAGAVLAPVVECFIVTFHW